jgi:hypothetical protein
MAVESLDYTYDYAFASHIDAGRMQLATCGGRLPSGQFFRGCLRHPHVIGDLLGVLATVVRTHFHDARPSNRDPVVTSSPAMLRFEGFSGCCGVYARVDLGQRAFESSQQTFGTTNVDFNDPMRRELARLMEGERVELSVGREAIALHRGDHTVQERKVALPIRWIKAFGEVQVYQSQLVRQFEISVAEFRRFLPSLPRNARQMMYVVPTGKTVRLSQRPGPGAVPLHGVERLQVLHPLLPDAERLVVWMDPESGVSGWQVTTAVGSMFLLVSPELYRGFSGEGQLLEKLAGDDWQAALPSVQSLLDWQTTLDPAELAARTGHPVAQVQAALAVLGARGLAGFDATSGFYYHRQLPFDLDKVEQQQPRLRNARKLLDADGIRILTHPASNAWDVEVLGSGVAHFVRLRPDGDRCTCPWFSKHQVARGPCKHVLAARIVVEETELRRSSHDSGGIDSTGGTSRRNRACRGIVETR